MEGKRSRVMSWFRVLHMKEKKGEKGREAKKISLLQKRNMRALQGIYEEKLKKEEQSLGVIHSQYLYDKKNIPHLLIHEVGELELDKTAIAWGKLKLIGPQLKEYDKLNGYLTEVSYIMDENIRQLKEYENGLNSQTKSHTKLEHQYIYLDMLYKMNKSMEEEKKALEKWAQRLARDIEFGVNLEISYLERGDGFLQVDQVKVANGELWNLDLMDQVYCYLMDYARKRETQKITVAFPEGEDGIRIEIFFKYKGFTIDKENSLAVFSG
jgi:hypothetical protein